jgi:hypothetical protein
VLDKPRCPSLYHFYLVLVLNCPALYQGTHKGQQIFGIYTTKFRQMSHKYQATSLP